MPVANSHLVQRQGQQFAFGRSRAAFVFLADAGVVEVLRQMLRQHIYQQSFLVAFERQQQPEDQITQ